MSAPNLLETNVTFIETLQLNHEYLSQMLCQIVEVNVEVCHWVTDTFERLVVREEKSSYHKTLGTLNVSTNVEMESVILWGL